MDAQRERGAAAVEFALIVGLLFFLIFGIIELGLAWRSKHTIADAAHAGARGVSIGTSTTDADLIAVTAVRDALDLTGVDVEYVIIYEATAPGDAPSAWCLSGSPQWDTGAGSEPCNVYTQADLDNLVPSRFGCDPGDLDQYYCPTDRSSTVGSLDLVGVYVQGTASSYTGVSGDYSFGSQSVLPIEPTAAAGA